MFDNKKIVILREYQKLYRKTYFKYRLIFVKTWLSDMTGVASKILKNVAKTGEVSLDQALTMSNNKTKSHIDQYPLALLLEDNYLGISIDFGHPEHTERMKELNTAIYLHMYTLPKNENGQVRYMGITSTGAIKPQNERVFLTAKGALYLDERRSKLRDRIYSFIVAIMVGLIAAGFSAWIRGQIKTYW